MYLTLDRIFAFCFRLRLEFKIHGLFKYMKQIKEKIIQLLYASSISTEYYVMNIKYTIMQNLIEVY